VMIMHRAASVFFGLARALTSKNPKIPPNVRGMTKRSGGATLPLDYSIRDGANATCEVGNSS
jgi:hypothetical protein